MSNARLIVAAPSLLEACRGALAELRFGLESHGTRWAEGASTAWYAWVAALEKAIREAEGTGPTS
jgi:hypothetical protein